MQSEIEQLWEKLVGAMENIYSLNVQVTKTEARSLALLDVVAQLLISADPATKSRAVASLQVTEEGMAAQDLLAEYRDAYKEVREVIQATIPR